MPPTDDPDSSTPLIVHPEAVGFQEKATPKKPGEKMFFFKCKKIKNTPPVPPSATEDPYRTASKPVEECGSIHFRHAGYVQLFLPFMEADNEKRLILDSKQVMVCVKCKACYVWYSSQMYDVTDQIDLKAWEVTEKEAHLATGPGGQC